MVAPLTLQQLHDLEIPGGIEWTFDGAWRVWIGNPMRDEAMVGSEAEALEWLRKKAGEIYGVKQVTTVLADSAALAASRQVTGVVYAPPTIYYSVEDGVKRR